MNKVISEELEEIDSDADSKDQEASFTAGADLGTSYVVKVTRTDEEQIRDVESREYHLLKEIQHRNIVKAYDFFPDEQLGPHLILEFIDGVELLDYICKI